MIICLSAFLFQGSLWSSLNGDKGVWGNDSFWEVQRLGGNDKFEKEEIRVGF